MVLSLTTTAATLSWVMTICNLSEFITAVPPYRGLLGIDHGSVVLGLAVSDPMWRVASPLQSLKRRKLSEDIKPIITCVRERNIGGIVIGLPKNMDGTEGASAQSVRTFARNLLNTQDFSLMPITFWDERLSTAAVTRIMLTDDMTRKRRDDVVDKAAAAYILQGFLDAVIHQGGR